MNTILIDFSASYLGTVAKQGEHNKTELVFTLPEGFENVDYVNAEFERPDGTKPVVAELLPENGTVTVPLTQDITTAKGTLRMQLVGYEVDGDDVKVIAKTDTVRGNIEDSIEATEPVKSGVSFPERILAWFRTAQDKLAEMWLLRHEHANKAVVDEITAQTLTDVAANTAARHNHSNKATLDALHCDDLETPEPELGIDGMTDPYRNLLRWRNQYVRMIADGGVVQGAKEVTVNGKKYLRLMFYYDPAVEMYDIEEIGLEVGQTVRPRFIDIPIESSDDSTIIDDGLTLNGTVIDFGLGLMSSDITELEEDSHTHTNKAVIDDITAQTLTDVTNNTTARHTHSNKSAIDDITAQTLTDVTNNTTARHTHSNKSVLDLFGWTTLGTESVPTYNLKPIGFYPILLHEGSYSGPIFSNIDHYFGNAQTPATSITITSLNNSMQTQTNEFNIEFYSGSTATTLWRS